MEIKEYQEKAKRTINNELKNDDRYLELLLGLNGEVGELTDLYKKHFYQNHDLSYEKMIEEVGDIMWYLVNIVTLEGFDIKYILLKNIEKLEKRYPNGFNGEDSIKRIDTKEMNVSHNACFNQGCKNINPYSLKCELYNNPKNHICFLSEKKADIEFSKKTPKHLNNTNAEHYTTCKIQPFKYISSNNLNFFEGNIVKYITRYKTKNGIEDLKKAKDYLNYLIKNYDDML